MTKPRPNHPASGANAGQPVGNATQPCPSGPPWPTTPTNHEKYSLDDYVKMWEAKHCRKMTSSEHKALENGCIGITELNLGINGAPPLNNSYDTFGHAKKRAEEMRKQCAANGQKPRIFSQRFYSGGKSYTPDPVSGKVDMSTYHYDPRPPDSDSPDGYTNFDYGWYDEESNSWWHANHYHDPSDPRVGPMEVYRSSLKYYSRPLLDFDSQVFCVACGP